MEILLGINLLFAKLLHNIEVSLLYFLFKFLFVHINVTHTWRSIKDPRVRFGPSWEEVIFHIQTWYHVHVISETYSANRKQYYQTEKEKDEKGQNNLHQEDQPTGHKYKPPASSH